VPGGGLASDGRWIGCRPTSSYPSAYSRGYIDVCSCHALQVAFDGGRLDFFGDLARLREPAAFVRHRQALRDVEWI
jgi:hypothetical protein